MRYRSRICITLAITGRNIDLIDAFAGVYRLILNEVACLHLAHAIAPMVAFPSPIRFIVEMQLTPNPAGPTFPGFVPPVFGIV